MKARPRRRLAIRRRSPSASAHGSVSPPAATPGVQRSPIHPHVHMIVPGGGALVRQRAVVASRCQLPRPRQRPGAPVRGKMLAMLMEAHDTDQLKFFNTQAGLAETGRSSVSSPATAHQVGGLLQGAVRRARAGAALSLPLYPSRRHLETAASLQPTTVRLRSAEGTIALAAGPLADDAASPARVHQALPDPRAAQGFPPHPPLRALCIHQPRREHRDGSRTSSMSPPPAADPQKRPDVAAGYPACAALPMPPRGARMIVIEVFARGYEPRWRPTPSRIDTS